MKKLIIANWKMNPATYKEAEKLAIAADEAARDKKNVQTVLCMPFPWLTDFSHKRRGPLLFGAQNCFWESPAGPYTGEVSPAMLKNSGVEYVILGHSERRANLGETDEMVARKMRAAVAAGLKPVLCVGEPLAARKKGFAASRKFVAKQLKQGLSLIKPSAISPLPFAVCYEPVWAISTSGTDLKCRPDDAVQMIVFLRSYLKNNLRFAIGHMPFIYGGSVNGKKAASYLSRKEIDGALVGAASLKPAEFRKIIEAAEKSGKMNGQVSFN